MQQPLDVARCDFLPLSKLKHALEEQGFTDVQRSMTSLLRGILEKDFQDSGIGIMILRREYFEGSSSRWRTGKHISLSQAIPGIKLSNHVSSS
jgi:hypothetical protein